MGVKKGQLFDVEITDVAFGGRGLARVNGLTVFVDQVAPLDQARIRIIRKRKNYAEALLVELFPPPALAAAELEELADAQDALMHSERLASMGQLAAGVAHEVNNPLAGVQACLENMQANPTDVTIEISAEQISDDTWEFTAELCVSPDGVGKTVDEGLRYVAALSATIVPSEDLFEAFTAFMEKRPPKFTGE
mgnify:CR=1 FL=1